MQLIAENLSCERLGRRIFADVRFSLKAGDGLLVAGANGAGKSSLLRLIAGLLPPSGGSCTLEMGKNAWRGLDIGRHAHYCGHLDALKTSLDLKETIAFFAALSPGPARVNIQNILGHFGLHHLGADYPVKFLSAGQRKRLSLARLSVAHRPLWLLDEALGNLDTQGRALLQSMIREHRAQGGIVLLSHHGEAETSEMQRLDMNGFAAQGVAA